VVIGAASSVCVTGFSVVRSLLTICFEISGTELKFSAAGAAKQWRLGFGPQDAASAVPAVVEAEMARLMAARIQRLI
jgi:hypothetical protein